ncbi:DUF4192 family protein [Micromonospora sp. WMMC415]|uniref:DUF4192 domain-containing protein n=1 Tax=Micromonospora sp. WMMC415 TaxID=2675222 RepID=UPI0012B4F5B4|nr:DUF4192 domain-containing protein [Micromonospora sp. WMMC415]QGN49798.1 DUF4192 family protein [Micromonospora sp. WMMC415]
MHHDHPSRLPLTSISDLLAAVPYLLGFHPADSLVTVGLTGKRVTVAGRADLPEPATVTDWVHVAARQHLALLRNVDATTAILIGYGPATAVTPVIDALTPHVEAAGITVLDALRVTDGRYHSYRCQDPRCCPPDGTPFDPHHNPTALHAIVAGQTALPDRAALVASVAPTSSAAMTAATRRAQQRRLTVLTAAGRAGVIRAGQQAVNEAVATYGAGNVLTDDEAAWLTVLLIDIAVRDLASEATGTEAWHLSLWTDLTRRADPHLAAAPASLLAFTAWRQGQGALAAVALDRALAADPDYRLARLIDHALRHGIPPTALNDEPDPTL